jgi:translation initiation factor IF-2
MDLRARVSGPVTGTVLEARKDKGLGLVVSAIVHEGTLKVGDLVLAGQSLGKVRRIMSDRGSPIKTATPSLPVQVAQSLNYIRTVNIHIISRYPISR